jgi:hypothetical protein
MADVHSRFNLEGKVVRTTTDNGSNFVKAFTQFSAEATLLPDLPTPVAIPPGEQELIELTEELDIAEWSDENMSYQNTTIDEVLDDEVFAEGVLPPHMRCAAHTLNLVASVDADKALADSNFKSVCRKTMAKAQGLWNAQNRSVPVADLVHEVLGRRLVVPNATRWNSTFDAVVVLNELLSTNRQVERLCILFLTTKFILIGASR